jgi:hypothetical protein
VRTLACDKLVLAAARAQLAKPVNPCQAGASPFRLN